MAQKISLKLKDSTITPHAGYGAGEGELIKKEYVCPCGKGTVYYEKDDIPGFRDKDINTDCKECGQKYTFGQGTAELI